MSVFVGDGVVPEPLSLFSRALTDLGPDGFADRFSGSFLVFYGALPGPTTGQVTKGPEPTGFEAETTMDLGLFATPVQKTPRCAFPFVAVGRAGNNDVVLGHDTVSKFHAMFRFRDGRVTLQDAKSRNGTFLDGTPVPHRDEGEPVRLQGRHVVRFGSLDAQYFDRASFVDFVHSMKREGL